MISYRNLFIQQMGYYVRVDVGTWESGKDHVSSIDQYLSYTTGQDDIPTQSP